MLDSGAFAPRAFELAMIVMVIALAESSIQLVPDGTLFLHGALILLMIGILNRTLFRPVNAVLMERERRTYGKLDEAQRLAAEAEEKARLLDMELRSARNEGYRLLEKERAEALREREAHLAKLKEELASWLDVEKESIHRQAQQAQASLRDDAKELASIISSRILGRQI